MARGEEQTLEFETTEPGVYRAEIRIMPWHLRAYLGFDDIRLLDDAELAGTDYVWVYGNPIYVR